MAMEDFFQELVQGFEVEAAELVGGASSAVMELEQADAKARGLLLERLGRNLHTLKGSAGTCGLVDVSELAHKLEDLIAPAKKSVSVFDSAMGDLVLKGLDLINARVRAHARGLGASLQNLHQVMPELFGRPALSKTELSEAKTEEGVDATQLAVEELAETVRVEESPLEQENSSWRVDNRQILNLIREVERLRELGLNLQDRSQDISKILDDIAKGNFGQESKAVSLPLQRLKAELFYDIEASSAVVELLESHLKAIYSVAVGKALESLQRVLRDSCRSTGKLAKLSISGAELMLDRRILEGLQAPLVHLLRNAVDHGLEMPEKRDALGKHKEGALVIRAEQQGNWLNLEFSDDGQGLDPKRLKDTAISKGLISRDAAQTMNDLEAVNLIFKAGFSTASEVSRLSGRGVGMDVVQQAVKQLHGSMEIQSTPGQGTRFLMTLPLSLGASPIMLLRSGQGVFGVPVQSVESVFKVAAGQLEKAGEEWRILWQDSWLKLADLGAVLGLRATAEVSEGANIMVLQSQGKRLALLVEDLEGDAELVILPLPDAVADEAVYQGAALHAGSELLLVLRSDWLIEQGGARGSARGKLKALVIDDSLTARAMHRGILESGGYQVYAAASAFQALAMIEAASYDVIICDVSMEGMDGLEFSRRVKSAPLALATPIVLVSANDSDSDRALARDCGAEAFISKRDCAAGRLLDEVAHAMTVGKSK